MEMKQMKLLASFLLTAIAGGILGVLVQMGSLASWGYWDSPMLAAFGNVSYGLFFWIFVCTALAYHARCGMHAALLTATLLFPTLCSYRLAAWYFGAYLNRSLLMFGMMMLLPACGAAWVLRANRHRRWMRVLVRLGGIAALIFDIQARGSFSLRTMMLAMPMLVMFLYVVHCAAEREIRMRRPNERPFDYWGEQLAW